MFYDRGYDTFSSGAENPCHEQHCEVADDGSQGDGDGLMVEFITVPREPPRPPEPSASPSASSSTPAGSSSQARVASQPVEAMKAEVLGESGDYASLEPAPNKRLEERVARVATTDEPSSSKGGHPGDDLLMRYQAALRAAIRKQWTEQVDRPFPTGCTIRLIQSTGGVLNASSAANCDLPRQEQLQLEAAALMAQPLPYAGYEAAFAPELELLL